MQQTTVPAAIPYFLKFIDLYPTVYDLAAAPEAEVMGHWAGLGYYSRARNLMKAAQEIASAGFPERLEDLTGVGRYTAAAINTIAFNKPDVVVDGNVERIVSRLYAVDTPLPAAKKELYALSAPLYGHHHGRSGALAQAFMDLGSLICLPKNPKCDACPIQKFCKAQSDVYPKRAKKAEKPQRIATAYWIENEAGEVLFERRPDAGLLGGTIGLPCTDLKTGAIPQGVAMLENDDVVGVVKHIFTHFALTMTIERAQVKDFDASRYFWARPQDMKGVSSLFKKALNAATR